jgi:hypothetical protein
MWQAPAELFRREVAFIPDGAGIMGFPRNVPPFPTVVAISGFALIGYLVVPKENAFSPGDHYTIAGRLIIDHVVYASSKLQF